MPRSPIPDTVPYIAYALFGAVLWGLCLALIRVTGSALEGAGLFILFLGITLFAAIALVIAIRMAFKPTRLVEAIAVVAVTGLLLDGVVAGFWPYVFGPDERVVRTGLAFRAWTGGVLLLAAILLEHRPAPKR